MAKFIEIHAYGTRELLNLNSVTNILESSDGKALIYFTENRGVFIEPEESYEQVRQMIGATQGGIPINPWRMNDA